MNKVQKEIMYKSYCIEFIKRGYTAHSKNLILLNRRLIVLKKKNKYLVFDPDQFKKKIINPKNKG